VVSTVRSREPLPDAIVGCLSNREIADRLVVSVRTVDNHLHNAYSKLGITKRSELAPILLPESPDTRRI
jgi:DNA-binding NarL/FixJ family response regulator